MRTLNKNGLKLYPWLQPWRSGCFRISGGWPPDIYGPRPRNLPTTPFTPKWAEAYKAATGNKVQLPGHRSSGGVKQIQGQDRRFRRSRCARVKEADLDRGRPGPGAPP